jgi:hypothetical protein
VQKGDKVFQQFGQIEWESREIKIGERKRRW